MMKSVIEIKDNISDKKVKEIKKIIEKEFDNRAGKIKNSSTEKYKMIFRSDKPNTFAVISLAVLSLDKMKGIDIKKYMRTWTWVEEKTGETDNVLQSLEEIRLEEYAQ